MQPKDPIEIDPSSFLQTLILKKREILIGGSALIAGIAILIVYFQQGPNAATYAAAEGAFAKWESRPQDETLYTEMKSAFAKVPSLEKKYEGAIAQKLLDLDKKVEGLKKAQASLTRVGQSAPFHGAYAETTLLIEQGTYQKALERAVKLKEEMIRSLDLARLSGDLLVGGSLLYAHNLLRIAILHQELENPPGEKCAWEEFENFLNSAPAVSDLVRASFSEKDLSLKEYIAERKKQL
ncbi:MAG: hypothetical protein V4487_01845 [Chlamydiota bacterium]